MVPRDGLTTYDEDPGWYQHPAGTVALKASDAELARDGIDVNEPMADAVKAPLRPRPVRPRPVAATATDSERAPQD